MSGGEALALSKPFLTRESSAAIAEKTSADFFSMHRLTASRCASDAKASSSCTPISVVAAPSKAVLTTLVNMTSRSLSAPLKAL